MRKEIIGAEIAENAHGGGDWLDLSSIARVQLSSEDPAFPIENALSAHPDRAEAEWRATTPGPQTITIVFDAPQSLRRISLRFNEQRVERSQEFLLRYSSAQETNRDIVRQQWSFSPTGSSQELEDYTVELAGVTKLELIIDPDRGRRQSVATLSALRLA